MKEAAEQVEQEIQMQMAKKKKKDQLKKVAAARTVYLVHQLRRGELVQPPAL